MPRTPHPRAGHGIILLRCPNQPKWLLPTWRSSSTSFFGHCPELVTIGDMRDAGQAANRQLHICAPLSPHHAIPILLSLTSLLISYMNRTPVYLNASICGNNRSLTWSQHSIFFRPRTTSEVLILIPATANHSSPTGGHHPI